MRSAGITIPVIFLTVLSDDIYEQAALEGGAVDFIDKTRRLPIALIQDAAYQSLLKRTRQQYHERAAKLLEDRFPEVTSTQPELVAHHYTEANCPAQAIAYWLKAGVAAARQSANVEAVDQFRRGLALVEALPDECEKAERELDLQMALGPALYATKSYSHPDLGRAY
jgi:predicted ATPase